MIDDYDDHHINRMVRITQKQETLSLAVATTFRHHPIIEHVLKDDFEPLYPALSEKYFSQDGHPDGEIVSWSLPGHGRKADYCGFKVSKEGRFSLEVCPRDTTHHARFIKSHCWKMDCPECFNDTALRTGSRASNRLLSLKYTSVKGGEVNDPIHVIISPPQDWSIRMLQRERKMKLWLDVVRYVIGEIGLTDGCMVIHPWRLQNGRWVLGPHVHVVGYGYLQNTKTIRSRFKGWVVKNKGSRQSVKHTVAYLLTHAGLATWDHPDELDWYGDVIEQLYSKGKYDSLDLEELKVQRIGHKLHSIRWFGGLSYKKMRVLDFIKEVRERVCPKCGAVLNVLHDTLSGGIGEKATYYHGFRLFVRSQDYSQLIGEWKNYKAKWICEGWDMMDIVRQFPRVAGEYLYVES